MNDVRYVDLRDGDGVRDGALGLIGVTPTLLLFQQPFGINTLVGLIALPGILMRNTLILIGQIRSNEMDGLAPFDAVVEATVQRSRPVILTALAAMLAFNPLTHSPGRNRSRRWPPRPVRPRRRSSRRPAHGTW